MRLPCIAGKKGPFSDIDLSLPQGIYLFLGYSTKDEELLHSVTGDGVLETIGAIQALVSYHNINSNKVSIINWTFFPNPINLFIFRATVEYIWKATMMKI